MYHPLQKRGIDFRHSETFEWTNTFFDELRKQRKVALRLGELSDEYASFLMNPAAVKDICSGKRQVADLSENDFSISFQQKGVDMKIGLDIAAVKTYCPSDPFPYFKLSSCSGIISMMSSI